MRGLFGAVLGLFAGLAVSGAALAATPPLEPHDFLLRDFHFRSGETLPALKLHYYTLGQPKRDAAGHIVNAVLILHGTGGPGGSSPRRSSPTCCSARRPLDPARYFIILPDNIGHGGSSKPSDGLHRGSRTTPTPTWSRPSTPW